MLRERARFDRGHRAALLLLASALVAACAPDPAPAPRESVIRLDWPAGTEGAARTRVEAGEQREAVRVELPWSGRVCRRPGAPRRGLLEIGIAPTSASGSVGVRLGGDAPDTSLSSDAWRDVAGPIGDEPCLSLELEGDAGSAVDLSRPVLIVDGVRRPWVLMYVVDTLRFDYLPHAGAPTGDAWLRISEDAVVYRRALATSSWTRPTSATLLTGLGPSAHRVYGRRDRLPDGTPRLATWLARAGYETTALTTNPNVRPEWGFAEGFDHFVDVPVSESAEAYEGFEQRVVSRIAAHADRPLFLYVHDNDPHFPYARTGGEVVDLEDFEREAASVHGLREETLVDAMQGYASEVAATGVRIERVLAALKRIGRYRDAVVVIVGDHGEEFGEHGGVLHGRTLYQEQLHVPLILKAPAARRWRGRVDAAVTTESVATTVLQLLDLAPADAPHLRRLPLPGEEPAPGRPLFAELALGDARVEGVVHWPFKYLRDGEGREQLFDLARDPQEQNDVAARHPELVTALRAALEARRAAHRSGLHVRCVAGPERTGIELTLQDVTGEVEGRALESEDTLRVRAGRIVSRLVLRPGDESRASGWPGPKALARITRDRDGLRAAAGAETSVEVRVLRGDARLEGPSGRPLESGETVSAASLRTPVARRHSVAGDRARCRLTWIQPEDAPVRDEDLVPQVRERLRALGYLEPPPTRREP